MPAVTLTTHDVSQPLVSGASATNPVTSRFASRVQFQNQGPGTVYLGVQPPKGVGSTVNDTTTYDYVLLPTASIVIGWGDDVYVDLGNTYAVADADTTVINYAPETY